MRNSESSAAPAATARSADLIAAVDQLRDVDCVASATDFGPSSQAQTAIALLHEVRALHERLDVAWVSATLAQIVLQRPWLQSVDVEISAESVYDDAGGSCTSHSPRFDSAMPVPDARFPQEVAAQDGRALDARPAAEELAIDFEDCVYDFAAPLLLPNVVVAGVVTTLVPRVARRVTSSNGRPGQRSRGPGLMFGKWSPACRA